MPKVLLGTDRERSKILFQRKAQFLSVKSYGLFDIAHKVSDICHWVFSSKIKQIYNQVTLRDAPNYKTAP